MRDPELKAVVMRRWHPTRGLTSVAVLSLALASVPSRDAHAWNFSEHRDIGREAYRRACALVRADEAFRGSGALEFMCPSNDQLGYAQTVRFGQACAIAGDHLEDVNDFLADDSGYDVHSFGNYLQLALENHSHFHPATLRLFRIHFGETLRLAVDAKDNGAEFETSFERIFYTAAFSSHFLQDAFSAGHMGFNRPASGAVVSKRFHDHFNGRGRTVYSAEIPGGWRTYGDGEWMGKCRSEKSADGKSSVCQEALLKANTAMLYAVFRTVLTRARDFKRELEAMNQLPTMAKTPRIRSVFWWDYESWPADTRYEPTKLLADQEAKVFEEGGAAVHSTAEYHRPAYQAQGIAAWAVRDFHIQSGKSLSAMGLSYSTSLLSFVRLNGSLGWSPDLNDSGNALAIGGAFEIPMFTLFGGLISTELVPGGLVYVRDGRNDHSLHAGLRVNVEAGVIVLAVEGGAGWLSIGGDDGFGLRVLPMLSFPFDAMGGGVRYR